MKQLGRLFLLIAVAITAQSANALPRVEGQLQQILSAPQMAERQIGVMLTYKDAMPINGMLMNRYGTEMTMQRNADLSQANVLQLLQSFLRQEAPGRIQFNRYWLGNSMSVRAPARVIAQLLQSDSIQSARLIQTLHIVRPIFQGRTVQPADGFTYGLTKMRIPDVRAKAPTLDGRGIRVGILDTGIDETHPDLRGKVLAFKDFVNNKSNAYDDHGHGSHVAGTISGGNASGTNIGVAPGVKLIIGKIFDAKGSADEDKILAGLQWIADPDGNPSTDDGPMLVSNSWGGGYPTGNPTDDADCRALDAWMKLGILPVFAAGNDGPGAKTVGLPGACPSAFAVGATDSSDKIAYFSSRGPAVWNAGALLKPEVSAPGVNVHSSIPGGKYEDMSGTSMATPHVSGVAALVFQAHPGIKPDAVAKFIIQGSVDLGAPGPDPIYGNGRVDAFKALQLSFGVR